MIKVNELFSGIGAFRKALINLNIPHEIVGISEIDKYAIKSYEVIYGKTRNYGDISKIDKLDYADLWTYGFPCQDISVAGLQQGIIKNETRSGLLFEVRRLLVNSALDDELPKYLIMENVKNLVGKKFKADFDKWLNWLEGIGYKNYWKVLNAKDYEVPQNRERVFVISIHKSIENKFEFPKPIKLELILRNFLEEEIEEKFYITDGQLERMKNTNFNQNSYNSRVCENESISRTLWARDWKDPTCVKIGDLRGEKWEKNLESNKRVYSANGVSPTLTTCGGGNTEAKIYTDTELVRKMTPKEYWRLMGFDDEDFKKAERVCSNTQLYKQAGNSIVVNVLEAILKNLLVKEK